MLIVSPEFSCSQEVLTIVAMLSGAFYFIALLVGLTIPRLQFPTFGYDRTTCGKKLMLQSNCSAYLMGTISLSLMSLTSIRVVRIALILYSRLPMKLLSYRST